MPTPHRTNRVRQQLLRELSDIVMHLRDPRVRMVTVVDVDITRDLRLATLYVSLIGNQEEQEEATQALGNALGHIRREVAQRVQLRFVPEVRVVYDASLERAARVTRLIDSVTKREGDQQGV